MFTFNKNAKTISGTINGKVFGIHYNEEAFKTMVELQDKFEASTEAAERIEIVKQFQVLIDSVSAPEATVQSTIHPNIILQSNGRYYFQIDGKTTKVSIPSSFIDRMKNSIDKNISIEPLIKFWARFLRNQKFRSLKSVEAKEAFAERLCNYVDLDFCDNSKVQELIDKNGYTEEVAKELCTVKQVKISKEGLLCTFKVSKEISTRYRLNEKGEKESYDVYAKVATSIDPITGLVTYEKADLPNEKRVFEPAVVGTSYEEFYCGESLGHMIMVGQVHRLKNGWKSINTDDDRSCVPGLHKTMCLN
jgi:hypothetical protein